MYLAVSPSAVSAARAAVCASLRRALIADRACAHGTGSYNDLRTHVVAFQRLRDQLKRIDPDSTAFLASIDA